MKAYAAVGVELEVTDAAEIKLRRAILVGDAGEIVDRDGMAAQYDGGFLQAASWTIHEQVTWDRDGVTSRDWETYPILGFDNVPEIETVLMNGLACRFRRGRGRCWAHGRCDRECYLRRHRPPPASDAVHAGGYPRGCDGRLN